MGVLHWELMSDALAVEVEQPGKRVLLIDVGGPAIGGGDRRVEVAMQLSSQAGRSL